MSVETTTDYACFNPDCRHPRSMHVPEPTGLNFNAAIGHGRWTICGVVGSCVCRVYLRGEREIRDDMARSQEKQNSEPREAS